MGGVADRHDLADAEVPRQRADAFQHQPFGEQAVTFFGGVLDLGVRHLMVCALQAADEQRRLLLIMHQRKGDLRQHHAVGVAQQQRGFPFFIQLVDRCQFQRDRRFVLPIALASTKDCGPRWPRRIFSGMRCAMRS